VTTTAPATTPDVAPGPLTPVAHRVVASHRAAEDVVTMSLEPVAAPPMAFRAGQFNMLTAFGIGEAAISISGVPGSDGPLEHTVRDVGPVSRALCQAPVGAVVGVRGPFGTDWAVDRLDDRDVVVVAGGIGLAPLRGAIALLATSAARRSAGRRTAVLVGARQASQIIFGEELDRWADLGVQVEQTVDLGSPGWGGHVGLVTTLLPRVTFPLAGAVALMCGPEVMMRFAARALVDAGADPAAIAVSLERNMQCGVGWCGHCQLGPLLVCRDGPVVAYDRVARLFDERER
jgi:NAD(P)H-flavin reductase